MPDAPYSDRCLNCGQDTAGAVYCPSCGQKNEAPASSLRSIASDYAEDVLAFDGKFFRSVGPLLLRPGRLTEEYMAGRKQRYIRPLRLYLVLSLAFFFVLGIQAGLSGDDDSSQLILTNDEGGRVGLEGGLEALTDSTREELRRARREAWSDSSGNIGLDDSGDKLTVNFGRTGWGFADSQLARREVYLRTLDSGEFVRRLKSSLRANFPKLLFLLLPLFALLLQLLYARQRRYYLQHFVFALHLHSLFFALLLLGLASPWGWLNSLLALYGAAYLYVAMLRVYRQGWLKTGFKYSFFMAGYTLLFALGAGVGALFTILTL